MDYKLAALKVVCRQLNNAKQTESQNAMTLHGILFQRVWLQGVLVSKTEANQYLLDDGTGILEIRLSGDFLQPQWKLGMYVMVVGVYLVRTSETPILTVHKIVDLTEFPDREAMWYLEVMEVYKLFYQPT